MICMNIDLIKVSKTLIFINFIFSQNFNFYGNDVDQKTLTQQIISIICVS